MNNPVFIECEMTDGKKIWLREDHISSVFRQKVGSCEFTTVVLNNGLFYEVVEDPYYFHEWWIVKGENA